MLPGACVALIRKRCADLMLLTSATNACLEGQQSYSGWRRQRIECVACVLALSVPVFHPL